MHSLQCPAILTLSRSQCLDNKTHARSVTVCNIRQGPNHAEQIQHSVQKTCNENIRTDAINHEPVEEEGIRPVIFSNGWHWEGKPATKNVLAQNLCSKSTIF